CRVPRSVRENDAAGVQLGRSRRVDDRAVTGAGRFISRVTRSGPLSTPAQGRGGGGRYNARNPRRRRFGTPTAPSALFCADLLRRACPRARRRLTYSFLIILIIERVG